MVSGEKPDKRVRKRLIGTAQIQSAPPLMRVNAVDHDDYRGDAGQGVTDGGVERGNGRIRDGRPPRLVPRTRGRTEHGLCEPDQGRSEARKPGHQVRPARLTIRGLLADCLRTAPRHPRVARQRPPVWLLGAFAAALARFSATRNFTILLIKSIGIGSSRGNLTAPLVPA